MVVFILSVFSWEFMVFCPLFPRILGCFARFFAAKIRFFFHLYKYFTKKIVGMVTFYLDLSI